MIVYMYVLTECILEYMCNFREVLDHSKYERPTHINTEYCEPDIHHKLSLSFFITGTETNSVDTNYRCQFFNASSQVLHGVVNDR